MGAGASVRRGLVFGVSLAIIAMRRAAEEDDNDDEEDEEEEDDYDYDYDDDADEADNDDDYDLMVDIYDMRRMGGG